MIDRIYIIKMLRGICSTGSWLTLSNFNKLSCEIMSILAKNL